MIPLPPTPLLLLGLAAMAVCGPLVIMAEGGGKRRLARRAKQLGAPNRGARRPVAGPQLLRHGQTSGIDAFLHRIIPRPAALRARLSATGTGLTIARFITICLGLAAFLGVALLIRGVAPLAALLIGLAVGFWFPHFVVGFLVNRRRRRFSKLFPEAIGLIVRGLKAGLPVTETMMIVGREIKDPVGEEFRRIADQIKLGQSIEDAMWAVARRLDLAEFNFLVITLSVQRETGGNLAETLDNLNEILRRREQMRLKVKAMSSEAIASAGIIGALPFVMFGLLYAVSPEYIMLLFTTNMGYVMSGVGGLWMAIGVVVMWQMVRFEI